MSRVTRLRLSVTVSYPMMVANRLLSVRNGLSESAQAALLLRQALARTMDTAEVQRVVRAHMASRSVEDWREDTMVEHAMEVMYAEKARGADADTVAVERAT